MGWLKDRIIAATFGKNAKNFFNCLLLLEVMIIYIKNDGSFKMNILVIDAQGGGIGKQIVSAIKENISEANITAVGTNVMATTAMLKAGADGAATGENAVIVGCREADVIIGPIGIVVADSMLGEVTPLMAKAVAQSNAIRFLIPVNICNIRIVGVREQNVAAQIEEIVKEIKKL